MSRLFMVFTISLLCVGPLACSSSKSDDTDSSAIDSDVLEVDSGQPSDVADVQLIDDGANHDALVPVDSVGLLDTVGSDQFGQDSQQSSDMDVWSGDDGSSDGSDIASQDVALTDTGSPDGQSSLDSQATDATDAASLDSGTNWVDTQGIDTSKPQVAWQDPNMLQAAQFTDVTAAWSLPDKALYAWCAVAGRFDKDSRDDALFVQYTAKGGAKIVTFLLGGAQQAVVESKVNTSMIVPNLGCGVFDFDGDDDDDLWLGGTSGLALYENDGSGNFTDVTAKRLPFSLPSQPWSLSAADWDGDGDLDLLVGAGKLPASCKTVTCGYVPGDFTCQDSQPLITGVSEQDVLLTQNSAQTFDVADKSWQLANTQPYATTVSDYDLDGDGDPDLLQGNDYGQQFVWMNASPGWQQLPAWAGVTGYANAMGWGVADFDGDGIDELVQTDFGPAQLWQRLGFSQSGMPVYQDVAAKMGIAAPTWAASNWNPLVADFDFDGRPDLWLGISMSGSPSDFAKTLTGCNDPSKTLTSVDVLWLNQGGSTPMLALKAPKANCADVAVVAQSLLDIDDDGDLDIIQVRPGCAWPGGVVRVLRNDLPNQGKVAKVRLRGTVGNRHAIGATIVATVSGKVQRQYVYGNRGIGSTSTRTKYFGLGSTAQIDSLKVYWPGGKQTSHGPVKAGQTLLLQAP